MCTSAVMRAWAGINAPMRRLDTKLELDIRPEGRICGWEANH